MAGQHAGPPAPAREGRRSGEHRIVKIKASDDSPDDSPRPRASLMTVLVAALLATVLMGIVGLAGLIVARTPGTAVPVPARPVVVTVPPAPAPTVIITTPRKVPTPHG